MKVAEPLVLVQLAKLLNSLTNQNKFKTHPLKGEFFIILIGIDQGIAVALEPSSDTL